MNEQDDIAIGPRVLVEFHSSSQPKGQEGYLVRILDGSTGLAADKLVMERALRLRQMALDALKGPSLEEQLEESLAPTGASTAKVAQIIRDLDMRAVIVSK